MTYKVLQSYTDMTTEKLVAVGTVVELTEERYQVMARNASVYGGIEMFLEEVVETEVVETEVVETEKSSKARKS